MTDMAVELTELEKLEVTRVDAVGRPANGFPVLLMKGVAEPLAKAGHGPFTGTHSHAHAANGAQGDDDEHEHSHSHDGDADHGHSHASKAEFDRDAALELVKAIVGRKVDETPDIAGGTAVISQIADLIIGECQEIKAGNVGEIADVQQLACAAEIVWCWRTGEESVASGSVMPATALMQSAAENPPEDDGDTSKSQIAEEDATVDTDAQTGGLAKAVEEAVAKATEPLEKLRKELEEAVAKVKATPVPGGPVLSANVQVKRPGGVTDDGLAAKAALMRQKADDATAPADRDGYLAYARELDEQARKAIPAAS